MASAMSKRQQARNERALQDLIRTVPGNDRCADCAAKNPAWASWNLGIFLCMRCAALHRKLGTHISKVKSLSMDSWSSEQVENMKKVGNVASNKIYNPRNVRPEIPVDVDEVDIAIEKFVRQKYDQRSLSANARTSAGPTRQNTGSTETGSWQDEPPPLPPKPGKKFGFSLRSSGSALPRSKSDRFTPPLSPAFTGSDRSNSMPSPKKTTKSTQLFGMRITTIENNFDAKLDSLRDMGFPDNKKNTELLKSMNGNLEKTVEALTRLGEGVKSTSQSHTPAPRALTPVSIGSTGVSGFHVEKRREPEKSASNPWEIREEPKTSVAQQSTQQEPPRSRSVPPSTTQWNPFLNEQPPPLPQQAADLGFHNLQISQPQNQYSNQQTQYQTSVSPGGNPWTAQPTPQRAQSTSPYAQQYQQPLPPQPSAMGNPFFQTAQPQPHATNNPWTPQFHQQQQQSSIPQQSSNPFGSPWQPQSVGQQQPSVSPSPMYGQQTDFFTPPQPMQQQTAQQLPQSNFSGNTQNPWFQQASPQPTVPQQHYFQQPQVQQPPSQPTQQYVPQQPVRHDKSSILALYNHPQLAPQRPLQSLPENGIVNTVPQRSVTMPAQTFTGNMNPFAQGPPQTTQSVHHVSNESVDFQGLAGNGRHSPDAFSGLSARYMR